MIRTDENYVYDCACYCYPCLPVETDHPKVDDGSGEQDTPAHCSVCDVPLNYLLTLDGVAYVIDKLLDELDEGQEEWDKRIDRPGTFYHGCRHVEITRDWAKDLKSYCLDRRDKFIVETFLEATAPKQLEPAPIRTSGRRRRALDLAAIVEGR